MVFRKQVINMYRLTTRDDDVWEFEELEEARKNQFIFGGKIEKIEDTKEELSE